MEYELRRKDGKIISHWGINAEQTMSDYNAQNPATPATEYRPVTPWQTLGRAPERMWQR